MRVLVTGVAGFIGSRVAQALVAAGDDVIGLIRPDTDLRRLGATAAKIDLRRCDLADTPAIARLVAGLRPECAIHLAWYAVHGKYWTAPENLDCLAQSLALARTLAAAGCRRFVGAGTCAEYDWREEHHHELSTPCRPHTLYGAAKLGLFLTLDRFCAGSPMSFAWARYNFTYGPGEAPARLVPSVIQKLMAGEEVPMTEGTQLRDFLHVDDVAAATRAIACSAVNGAINVGSGEVVSLKQVATLLAGHFNAVDRLRFGALPARVGEPPALLPDVTRLQKEVGWRPALSLIEGLDRTVQFFRGSLAR